MCSKLGTSVFCGPKNYFAKFWRPFWASHLVSTLNVKNTYLYLVLKVVPGRVIEGNAVLSGKVEVGKFRLLLQLIISLISRTAIKISQEPLKYQKCQKLISTPSWGMLIFQDCSKHNAYFLSPSSTAEEFVGWGWSASYSSAASTAAAARWAGLASKEDVATSMEGVPCDPAWPTAGGSIRLLTNALRTSSNRLDRFLRIPRIVDLQTKQ